MPNAAPVTPQTSPAGAPFTPAFPASWAAPFTTPFTAPLNAALTAQGRGPNTKTLHAPNAPQAPQARHAAPAGRARARPVPRAAATRNTLAEPPARLPPTLLAGAPGRPLAGLTHLLADTLGDQLTLAARRVQAPVAYIEGEERHTWPEVERAADHLACGLLALGLKRGDRLGVLAHNQIEWLLLFHAATRIGVAVVALTLGEDDASLAHLLSDSGAKVVFTLPRLDGQDVLALLGRLQPQLPQLRHVVTLGGDGLNSFASLAATPVDLVRLAQARRQVQPTDLAAVLYGPAPEGVPAVTGATPRPRGAGLSHRGLLAAAASHAVQLRISDADLLHLALPLDQVGALACTALPLLLGGGSLVLVPDGRPERLLALMARHRPTLLAATPATLHQLLRLDSPGRMDWQQVRLVCAGGAPVSADLQQGLADRMPRAELMTVYGLTETSGAVAITRWTAPRGTQRQTVGTCLPGWQVRVVDASGQPLPPGQVGELWLHGPGVLPGYVGAAAGQGLSADGWLMTGDLGEVDAQGVITVHGRLKDQPVQAGTGATRRKKPAPQALHAA